MGRRRSQQHRWRNQWKVHRRRANIQKLVSAGRRGEARELAIAYGWPDLVTEAEERLLGEESEAAEPRHGIGLRNQEDLGEEPQPSNSGHRPDKKAPPGAHPRTRAFRRRGRRMTGLTIVGHVPPMYRQPAGTKTSPPRREEMAGEKCEHCGRWVQQGERHECKGR